MSSAHDPGGPARAGWSPRRRVGRSASRSRAGSGSGGSVGSHRPCRCALLRSPMWDGPVGSADRGRRGWYRVARSACGCRACSPHWPARALTESTEARDQPRIPACPSRSSHRARRRFQTPARCHARSPRQHVLPEPQPSSACGMFQPIPVVSTNRVPASTAGPAPEAAQPGRLDRAVAAVARLSSTRPNLAQRLYRILQRPDLAARGSRRGAGHVHIGLFRPRDALRDHCAEPVGGHAAVD